MEDRVKSARGDGFVLVETQPESRRRGGDLEQRVIVTWRGLTADGRSSRPLQSDTRLISWAVSDVDAGSSGGSRREGRMDADAMALVMKVLTETK